MLYKSIVFSAAVFAIDTQCQDSQNWESHSKRQIEATSYCTDTENTKSKTNHQESKVITEICK